MQVGSFFEAYAIDNEKEKINIDNLNQICDLMNIQISRKNKNIIENSRSNPLIWISTFRDRKIHSNPNESWLYCSFN